MENKIINSSLIFLDEDLGTKEDVIQRIASKAQEMGYLSDAEKFYESVMKREAEVPTAIGYEVAIPHGKTDVVNSPFVAFFRSKGVFKWTPGYDDDVRLIFQIGVPETGTEKLHLKFISQVSKKLLDESFREKLALLKDNASVFELLNSIDL